MRTRSEAQPFAYEKLTEDQQKGSLRVLDILGAMITESKDWGPERRPDGDPRPSLPACEAFLPRIDPKRSSRVILIDGGRGAGKTSLLEAVLDALVNRLRESDEPRAAAAEPAPEAMPEGKAEFLSRARSLGPVVPIDLLSMHPLPESTDLLIYLAGHIRKIIDAFAHGGDPDECAPWHPARADVEASSTSAWRAFLKAAALGGNGNIGDRGPSLDPEAFVHELEIAERNRVELPDSFRKLIDALLGDLRCWLRLPVRQYPFVLVPIDDADMNPDRSVELLEMIRRLHHPRLAFLLTGDSDMFIETLDCHLARACLGRENSREDGERRPWVRKLAVDVYRKIIPSSHTCELRPLVPSQRTWWFGHLVAHERDQREYERGIPIQSENPFSGRTGALDLIDYLEATPYAGQALPGRLRALLDLSQTTAELIGSPSNDPLEADVARPAGWRKAPNYRVFLSKLWQQTVWSAPVDRQTRDALLPLVDVKDDVLVVDESDVKEVRLGRQRTELETSNAQLAIMHWRPGPHELHGIPERPSVLLPGEVGCALKLAGWIAFDTVEDMHVPPVVDDLGPRRLFACVVARLEDLGPGTTLAVPWVLPPWHSLDRELFALHWENVITGAAKAQRSEVNLSLTAEVVARLFLALSVRVANHRPVFHWAHRNRDSPQTDPSTGGPVTYDSLKDQAWPALAAAVIRILRANSAGGVQATARARANREWAKGCAGLLAAPESGLDPEDANRWLDALKKAAGHDWPRVKGALRRERADRLRFALESVADPGHGPARPEDAAQLAREIDATCGGYRWKGQVEQPGTSVRRTPKVRSHA